MLQSGPCTSMEEEEEEEPHVKICHICGQCSSDQPVTELELHCQYTTNKNTLELFGKWTEEESVLLAIDSMIYFT